MAPGQNLILQMILKVIFLLCFLIQKASSHDLAFDLSLSALLGDNIYNFGELLMDFSSAKKFVKSIESSSPQQYTSIELMDFSSALPLQQWRLFRK
ncbi:hypothetical protein ACB092_10G079400 [Castanea dentata]